MTYGDTSRPIASHLLRSGSEQFELLGYLCGEYAQVHDSVTMIHNNAFFD